MRHTLSNFTVALALFGTVGCADLQDDSPDVSSDDSALVGRFTVGGRVTGLVGPAVILRDNDHDTLVVHSDGTFTFGTSLAAGAPYAVTVFRQPSAPSVTCTVANGTGTIANANVTNVAVTCSSQPPPPPTYHLSGTVSGLAGSGLVLHAGADDLAIASNGSFAFPSAYASGAAYSVSVSSDPSAPAQSCTITNGSGTFGTADVSNIAVACTTKSFSVGGSVSGLSGTLVLQNNGGDDLTLAADGNFTFATSLLDQSAYAVTVAQQPNGRHCDVANASGTIASANVSSVAVTCIATTPDYYVDAANGNDANTGSAGSPWRTISMAIRTAPTTGANIHVAPGTYSAGETFPISPRPNQHLIGDVANHGEGVVPTRISGAGNFQCSGGDLAGFVGNTTVGLEAGAQGSSIAGFSITGGSETVWICNTATSFASNTVFGSTDISVIVGYRGNVSLTDNIIKNGAYGLLALDIETHLVARGNTITTATNHAVVLGFTNMFAGENFDFGTAASPGNNTFIGSSVGAGMYFQSVTNSVVNAQGNTWRAGVEGADAQGHYATQLVTSNVPLVAGTNYAVRVTTGGGLQL